MIPSSAEQVLITRIRQGDSAAWQRLIDEFEGRLLAFATRRLRDRQLAEDVVQETFVGFLTALPNYDTSTPLQAFLFSICAHKLTDRLRQTGRRPLLLPVTGDDGQEPAAASNRARLASSIARSREHRETEELVLARCLTQQIEAWRKGDDLERLKCLELLLVRGLANKEVATQLGIGEQAVANHKQFLVGKLREAATAARLTAMDEAAWGLE
ncbi:MAG: sigma-70 family RNA polymerase sigma factor [Planctomycetota bacterium]|nr:MAG: sigma-70 family RNA polymerase sigma factor [Planctomycetota bacterium]